MTKWFSNFTDKVDSDPRETTPTSGRNLKSKLVAKKRQATYLLKI